MRLGGLRWVAIASLGLAAWGCRTHSTPPACASGGASCAGACVSLDADPAHCGACGVTCGAAEVCQLGACVAICEAPLARCQTAAGPRCVDPAGDAQHCGGCGVACGADQACLAGACVNPCQAAGWRLCAGRCRQLAVDDRHCGGCGVGCADGQVCEDGICQAAAGGARPNLIVSITADDGVGTQGEWMIPSLEAHGMRGSFYVIVSRIDLDAAQLTSARLHEVSVRGHEVGLHGLTHLEDLVTVTPRLRVRREICDGRVALLQRGFEIRSMAYPFGLSDATSQADAAECGMNAARNVGNGAIGCTGCPSAESIPPANRVALRSPSSVKVPADVATLQRYVTAAEATGGWLILNFHHVIPASACTADCFPAEWFSEWLDWLAPRAAQGTVVRTIEQVMGGAVQPPIRSGTPPTILGDMESHLDGPGALPDCWTLGGEKANTSWASVPGRGGTGVATQIRVEPWVDGTHTLIQDRGSTNTPDYRSCGTQVDPGATYRFRCWIRGDTPVRMLLYANDDVRHSVSAWMRGPPVTPSATDWTELAVTAKVAPSLNTVFMGATVAAPCAGAGCLGAAGTATLQLDDCDAEVVAR